MQELPWAQSHAPRKLSEFAGNADACSRLKRWALEWERGNKGKPICLWGPPGVGKTALPHALASEMGWGLQALSPYVFGDAEKFKRVLSGAVSGSALLGGRCLLLLEDVDAWQKSGMRGIIGDVAEMLASCGSPAVLTAIDWYDRSLVPLRTVAEQLQMKAVNSSDMARAIKPIAASRGFSVSEGALNAIISNASGDLRAAINDLQASNTLASRERAQQIFQKVRMALRAQSYRASRQLAGGAPADRDMLKMYIAESLPSEFPDAQERARAYSRISRADVFDGRIKRLQYWGYLRYSSDLMGWGVASERRQPGAAFVAYAFPSYIQKMGASRGRRALFASAAKKIAAVAHTTPKKARAYFPLLAAQSDAQAVSSFWGFDEEETAAVLGVPPSPSKTKKGVKKPKSK